MGTAWREELAWAAGFFDGEGNSRLNKGYGFISIRQVDKATLDRFQSAVLGLGHIGGPYKNKSYAPIYSWYVSSFKDVQAVSTMLWPFLGEAKKSQLRYVLEDTNKRLLKKNI